MRFRRIACGISHALVLGLLCVGVAAEEPQTYPESGVQVFLGLDDTSAPTQVQDGRAQDLQNVTLDVSRSVRKRDGIQTIGANSIDEPNADTCFVTGLYYTKFSSGTERNTAICGTKWYFLNGSVWTTVGQTGITSGQNNQFVFTTALDNIIATNDQDVPLRWDGTVANKPRPASFTGLTTAFNKAKTVAFFKNYLIWGDTQEGGTDYPTRFRWSNVGTINTYSDEDYIDIGALGGQEINCMAELYDNLYVGLTDSLYKVSLVGGADTFQVSKVADDIGCIAKNSIQSITLTNAQNGLVFLDKDKKVYFFNGVVAQDITQLITATMGGLSATRLQYAVSADSNTDYFLCVTDGTGSVNNLCLDFQYQIAEWTKHTELEANAMAHVLDNSSKDQVYFGTGNALVYQLNNSDLKNDVVPSTEYSVNGTVSAISRFFSTTASSLQVIYDSSASHTVSGLIGAPIRLTGGTGSGQTGWIVNNTVSGYVVATDFTTTPVASSTTYEIGAIDAFYTTKWLDMGQSARLKHFGEVYFWAEADVSATHSLSYATDFNADISTLSLSMSASSSDAIWGSAIWGTSLWGSVSNIFRQAKLESQGRYLKIKFADDDPHEGFYLYGWVPVFWSGDIN